MKDIQLANFARNVVAQYGAAGGNVCIPQAQLPSLLAKAGSVRAKSIRNVQSLFAFSAVRWTFSEDAGGDAFTVLANQANVRKAFVYGVDDNANVGQAIDTAAYAPRWDDTNLSKAGKPPFGDMLIEKLSFIIRPAPGRSATGPWQDPNVLAALLGVLDVRVSTNKGDDGYHLGSPLFWPGGEAITGQGRDTTAAAGDFALALNSGMSPKFVRELSKPLVWRRNSETDGNLCVTLTPQHDFTVAYAAAAVVTATVKIDMWCMVEGISYGELSANG